MLALALLLSVQAPAPPVAPPTTALRIYVAPLRGTNTDAGVLEAVGDRVVVAANKHRDRFDVVSWRDVQSAMDVDAARQALGCDAESCAAEVADALAAPQIITGQLGRVGSVWQLTLTRTERSTMQALGRVSIDAEGDTPEGLLERIPDVVDELLGVAAPPLSPLVTVGGVGLGVGAAALLTAGALWALSWQQLLLGKAALKKNPPDEAAVNAARETGTGLLLGSEISAAAGALVLVGGGAALLFGLWGSDE